MEFRGGPEENEDICCGTEDVVIKLNLSSLSSGEQGQEFQYTPVNVPGPSFGGSDPREVQYSGCSCNLPSCDPASCPCITRFGPNYSNTGCLLQPHHEAGRSPSIRSQDATPSKPVFECNASCLCGERCVNRLVQNGLRHKMEVFRTTGKGWGLRTLENIVKDAYVCEYAGEILNNDEVWSRQVSAKPHDMNFVFVLKERYGEGKTTQTYIDARYQGSIARFINHSCEPNLYPVAVRVHNEIPRVALFALRDINSGEELSYHYCWDLPKEELHSSIAIDKSMRLCMCGSPSCQKYLPCDPTVYPVKK